IGVFDIFKIGIGPSSSHTVGPMRAARMFARAVLSAGASEPVQRVVVELYGSLGATGKGHATDTAVMLGLAGHDPETVDVERVEAYLNAIRASGRLNLLVQHEIFFNAYSDLPFLLHMSQPMYPSDTPVIDLYA